MPDFTNYSHFDANAAFTTVKYGSDALVLEVELNEAQNILDNKLSTLIYDRFGNGFYKTGSALTYATGTVTFADDKAFVNGNIVTISSLELELSEGETAYFDVWEQEVTYSSTLKKYGNQQESNTVTNYIKDSRVTEETTRRTQLQYNIVKTTGVSGHTYLPICTITGGSLVDSRTEVGSTGGGGTTVSKLYSSFTATSNGTSVCDINQPEFSVTTDVLDVFYQGVKLTPTVHYTVNGSSTVTLSFTIAIGEIIRFEVLKNYAVSSSTIVALGYYENTTTLGSSSSSATIGISNYNPSTDLLFTYSNSVYLKKDTDYTVSGTGGTAVVNKPSGTWESGTAFDFVVIKNVTLNVSSAIQTQIDGLQSQIDDLQSQIDTLTTNLATQTSTEYTDRLRGYMNL